MDVSDRLSAQSSYNIFFGDPDVQDLQAGRPGCCLCAASAQAGVAFDANIEFDTTYTDARDKPATKASTDLGGRVEINANAELARNGDYFVNGRASLIVPVNGDQTVNGQNNNLNNVPWTTPGCSSATPSRLQARPLRSRRPVPARHGHRRDTG